MEQKKQGWFYSREYIFFVTNISGNMARFNMCDLQKSVS